MLKYCFIILIFFAMLFEALFANNVVMLKNYIKSEYVRNYPEISIDSILLIAREKLDLYHIEILSKSINSLKNANGYLTISYKYNNKTMQENIKYEINGNIKIYLAGENISAKSNFKNTRLVQSTKELNALLLSPASRQEILQSSAKVYIPANAVITRNKIAKRVLVLKDAQVKIIFKSGYIEAISSGKALENGTLGESIKIENLESKRVISAQVVDDGAVRVGL